MSKAGKLRVPDYPGNIPVEMHTTDLFTSRQTIL